MPRYKFCWSNLPDALLHQLYRQLVEGGEDAADALKQIYGARPKDEFVREAWPILRDEWLGRDKQSRTTAIRALRERRREPGQISNRRAQ